MNEMLIKVSIIVVSLNTKIDFLETIESIKRQTYKNYETIVIDGKSNDGTVDEINKIKDNLSNFIIEKDTGIYDAMNKGIALAKGEWIIFLNSGDIFFDDFTLEKIFNEELSNKDVVFGNTVIKNEKYKYISIGKNFDLDTIVMPFCHQSSLLKSSFLKKNPFNLDFELSSDFNLFYLCCLLKKTFHQLNIPLTIVKSGGIADNKRQQVYSENISIMKMHNKIKNILKIYILKFFQSFKDLFKLLIPQWLINILLKMKYNKKII
jgi:glycosyltransferase involved in cell wall biosynthesis